MADENQAPPAVDSLDVAYANWKCRSIALYPKDTKDTLYTIDTHLRKPHLIFKHGDSNDAQFATVSCHTWTSKFDIEMNGNSFTTTREKGRYAYFSPALQQNVTWTSQSGFKNIDVVMLDQNELPIARWSTRGMKLTSWSRLGRIEFDNASALSSQARDEIVVVALALAYVKLTYLASASTAAAAS